MNAKTALRSAICDWDSRQPGQPVGDQTSRGVIPAAIPQTVKARRALGCCSPAIEPEIRLGEVKFIADHHRGSGCFDQSADPVVVTPVQLRF